MLPKKAPACFDALTTAQRKAYADITPFTTSVPALRLFDLSHQFRLEVDALKYGFGCILRENVDGRPLPYGSYSRDYRVGTTLGLSQ